ncbi:hypothetical protein [Amycolatopsis sp. NPDC004079]|uniref:hypothetical protein n=1 Tax=Amycolatopsis sp. NPDC004079 TaxID=3154549 RepID=UPI0033B6FC9B
MRSDRTIEAISNGYGLSMTDDMSLTEHARELHRQFGAFWVRVNAVVDDGTARLTSQEKAAVQRELADLARLPWDVAESLGGAPDEKLSDEAIAARARMLEHFGLDNDASPREACASVTHPIRTQP